MKIRAGGAPPAEVRRFISIAPGHFNDRWAVPASDRTMGSSSPASALRSSGAAPVQPSVALIGMMGAGKTSIGQRLARVLELPFRDADREIEKAAGTSIANIFAEVGEAAFRRSERQVIQRLLDGEPQVLALGGGAYMDPATRALIRERAVSVWLRASLDELVRRTARRNDRPLLHGFDPKERLSSLLDQRGPVYAQADLVVDSDEGSIRSVVDRIVSRLADHRGENDR
jgi:shikimate kinase